MAAAKEIIVDAATVAVVAEADNKSFSRWMTLFCFTLNRLSQEFR